MSRKSTATCTREREGMRGGYATDNNSGYLSLPPFLKGRQHSITILGATGTIGVNTLSVIAANPKHFRIETLTGNGNVALLAKQARQFKARCAVIANEALYKDLKRTLSGSGIKAMAGEAAIIEAASGKADIVMSAIVGMAGLRPTLAAISAGKRIAIANKETLVAAGDLMLLQAAAHKATLIPVDSEHNGIFQLLLHMERGGARRVTITASGGPFRGWTAKQMKDVTPKQAVKHPNWNMGAKISVDSATLMNKGLEMIEACQLFFINPSQLEVLIHPQSIVHAMVEMADGSVIAQMSNPDMRTPIACALAWPQRIEAPVKRLDLANLGSLTFEAPDEKRFPALRIAKEALAAGGSAPCVLNAANEIAVARFLNKDIGFLDIAMTVEKTLEKMNNEKLETLDDVLACDKRARRIAESL